MIQFKPSNIVLCLCVAFKLFFWFGSTFGILLIVSASSSPAKMTKRIEMPFDIFHNSYFFPLVLWFRFMRWNKTNFLNWVTKDKHHLILNWTKYILYVLVNWKFYWRFKLTTDWNSYSNTMDLLNFFVIRSHLSKNYSYSATDRSKNFVGIISIFKRILFVSFLIFHFGSKTFTSKITFRFGNIFSFGLDWDLEHPWI